MKIFVSMVVFGLMVSSAFGQRNDIGVVFKDVPTIEVYSVQFHPTETPTHRIYFLQKQCRDELSQYERKLRSKGGLEILSIEDCQALHLTEDISYFKGAVYFITEGK